MIIYILPLALPGIGSIALIAGALLLLFGGKKIPELMKGIGGGIKEFKKATKEETKTEEEKKEK
jgi:sec-independent protein translocase protein TatA